MDVGVFAHIFFTLCLIPADYLRGMQEKVFKKGDRVRCVDAFGCYGIEEGREYTVSSVFEDSGMVFLEEKKEAGIYARRFEPVEPAPPTLAQQIAELEAQLAALRKVAINESLRSLLDSAFTTVKSRFARGDLGSDTYWFGVSPRIGITVERERTQTSEPPAQPDDDDEEES